MKVMTFEKVLEMFKDFLEESTINEVVLTKHGYTTLDWDDRGGYWNSAEICETPERLLTLLSSAYFINEDFKVTKGKRELTADEKTAIQASCQKLIDQSQKNSVAI